MKKAYWTLGVLLLAAALLALPGPAKAEMYVEAYLGGAAAGDLSSDTKFKSGNLSIKGDLPGGSDPAVLAGLKIGTWFVPTGFLGYNYPDWMKYFGFYTDFSYQRLELNQKQFIARAFLDHRDLGTAAVDFHNEGYIATWAFMLAGRYGFFQDSEVPFGRLQPYVAVGPAIFFTSVKPKFTVPGTTLGISPGGQMSVNIGLAVDAGIRYMCLKNVSLDLSFKYRYTAPSYNFEDEGGFKYEPTYNLFSGQLGVAYHF